MSLCIFSKRLARAIPALLGNKKKGYGMKEILERIAKSLESIDAELKARNADRKKLLEEAERIEKKVIEIQADPFGLENLKVAALADKAKKKG